MKKYWFVIVIISIFLLPYDSIVRMWKLESWQKENRLKHLANIENIVNKCQGIIDSYVANNEYVSWREDLRKYSWGATPFIKVKFSVPGKEDSDYYCEAIIDEDTLEYELYEEVFIMDYGYLRNSLCNYYDRPSNPFGMRPRCH